MNFDSQTIRVFGRITDRLDLIRKNPHRYQVEPDVQKELGTVAAQLEALLTKITIIKAG
jgi:hypothetical protein